MFPGDMEQFPAKPKRVFLEGANFKSKDHVFSKVGPRPPTPDEVKALRDSEHIVFDSLKPMINFMKAMGLFPVACVSKHNYKVTPPLLAYSVFVFFVMIGYIVYIKIINPVEIVKSAEGRFEEAVIEYMFTVYLVPVIIIPVSWYEAKKLARVFDDWGSFERIYERIENQKVQLFMGSKAFMTTIALPIISCSMMVVTHTTMVDLNVFRMVPYCYVNTINFVFGGFWYLQCDVIGKIATIIADDFQNALKNIGPAGHVAEFRALWMLLARITREVGLGSCYVMSFLCLYLFLIITLTIYGLLSTLQSGFGTKDIGLAITAVSSIILLYFICDEAHYASNCVRVYLQKKLLLVELSWMNDDAQQEINMFLRATEMNPTDMSLGGFFDVNRNLFKSLLATMVTYLVVLLQFQISIPEDTDVKALNMTLFTTPTPK